jgi:hypothetical protein
MDWRTLGLIGVDLRSSAAHLSFLILVSGPEEEQIWPPMNADRRR